MPIINQMKDEYIIHKIKNYTRLRYESKVILNFPIAGPYFQTTLVKDVT